MVYYKGSKGDFMKTEDFNYYLPEELIAQTPLEKRDTSRLLVLDKETGNIEHKHFYDILDYLKPGDCLVLNDSRVLPARLYGRKAQKDASAKEPGAQVEFLLIKRQEGDCWETMVRPGGG